MRAIGVAALSVAVLIQFAPAIGQENDRALLGEWTGEFVCNGLPRSATVTFADAAGGQPRGEFSFLGPSNSGPPIGRFVVTARALPTGEFRVSPGRWLVQAKGYPALAFTVRRSPDGQRLTGTIDNVRCGAIELAYKKPPDTVQSQPPVTPPGPAPKGRTRERNGRGDLVQLDCESLLTPGARSDCAHTLRYVPGIGGSSRKPGHFANRELFKACEFAYQAIDADKAPECYSGLAAIGRWTTTVTDFAQENPSCAAFADKLRQLISHNFPMHAPTWRQYRALDCKSVDRIFVARGVEVDATCVSNRADRAMELANCSGQAHGTAPFRQAWLEALSQCRTGQQMSLYAAIKARRTARRINDLFEFGCADVVEIAARFTLVPADQLAAARREIAAAEPARPPRENDIIAALKADFGARLRCFDNRDRRMPEEFFRCTFTARPNAVERRHLDWLDDYMKGVMGGVDRQVTPPTIRLSLNEVVMHGCERTTGGFLCRYDVGIGCGANAMFEIDELDVVGRALEQRWCLALAGLRQRIDLLQRSQSGFEIIRLR